MKTFIIKSKYEYEIEANDEQGAIEKWQETIDAVLGANNQILINELCESLYAEEKSEVK